MNNGNENGRSGFRHGEYIQLFIKRFLKFSGSILVVLAKAIVKNILLVLHFL